MDDYSHLFLWVDGTKQTRSEDFLHAVVDHYDTEATGDKVEPKFQFPIILFQNTKVVNHESLSQVDDLLCTQLWENVLWSRGCFRSHSYAVRPPELTDSIGLRALTRELWVRDKYKFRVDISVSGKSSSPTIQNLPVLKVNCFHTKSIPPTIQIDKSNTMLFATKALFAILATLTAIPAMSAIPISSDDIAALKVLKIRGTLDPTVAFENKEILPIRDKPGELPSIMKRQDEETGGSGSCTGSGCTSDPSDTDPTGSGSGNETDDGGDCLGCSW